MAYTHGYGIYPSEEQFTMDNMLVTGHTLDSQEQYCQNSHYGHSTLGLHKNTTIKAMVANVSIH